MTPEWPLDPRAFAAYYSMAPAALAIRECIRLQAVRQFELPEPILDVGCGDGLFARLAYPNKQSWGIDINPTELQRAQSTRAYSTLICGNICSVDLPNHFFGSVIANCSLEHVPDLDTALRNIHGALKPNAPFVLIVPTPTWTRRLAWVEAFDRASLVGLGRAYGEALDQVFRHVHLYDAPTWTRHLESAGFEVRNVSHIAHRGVSWLFDLLLLPSFIGYLNKRMTGRWILLPGLRPLSVDGVRHLLDAVGRRIPDTDDGAEYLIECRARP